jgi:GT2 family glycosyltransferase
MAETLAIMPTYLRLPDDLTITKRCIDTLLETADAQVYVYDDGSPNHALVQGLQEHVDEWGPRIAMHTSPANRGFAATVNQGLRVARESGMNALLVNSDMFFYKNDWLKHMEINPAAVVGGLLLYPTGLVQHAGVYFSMITRRFDHIFRMAPHTLAQVREPRFCPVTGALMLIKHETLQKIGVLDENYKFGYEDIDYCHMVFQAGMKVAYEPKAEAVHHESWTAGTDLSTKHKEWMRNGLAFLHEKHRGKDFSDYVPTLIWDD